MAALSDGSYTLLSNPETPSAARRRKYSRGVLLAAGAMLLVLVVVASSTSGGNVAESLSAKESHEGPKNTPVSHGVVDVGGWRFTSSLSSEVAQDRVGLDNDGPTVPQELQDTPIGEMMQQYAALMLKVSPILTLAYSQLHKLGSGSKFVFHDESSWVPWYYIMFNGLHGGYTYEKARARISKTEVPCLVCIGPKVKYEPWIAKFERLFLFHLLAPGLFIWSSINFLARTADSGYHGNAESIHWSTIFVMLISAKNGIYMICCTLTALCSPLWLFFDPCVEGLKGSKSAAWLLVLASDCWWMMAVTPDWDQDRTKDRNDKKDWCSAICANMVTATFCTFEFFLTLGMIPMLALGENLYAVQYMFMSLGWFWCGVLGGPLARTDKPADTDAFDPGEEP